MKVCAHPCPSCGDRKPCGHPLCVTVTPPATRELPLLCLACAYERVENQAHGPRSLLGVPPAGGPS